jgi:hypothetical protein
MMITFYYLSLAHPEQGEVSRPAAFLCLTHSAYLLLVISSSRLAPLLEEGAVEPLLDGTLVEPPPLDGV